MECGLDVCILNDVVDLTLESFPADLAGEQVLYWHGVDKDNRKICKLCCFTSYTNAVLCDDIRGVVQRWPSSDIVADCDCD